MTTGFVIATVVVMPLTAFLGRLFGQKRVYLASLALFVLGSALCAFARSLPAMVAFRALQGLGAGALQPTEQAILRQTFPPEEQGMAMALFGLAVVVGPAAGPALGGYILDNFSWPWIFYINLPDRAARHLHGRRASCTSRRTSARATGPARPTSARTSTGSASCSWRWGWPRCSTCSRRGAATTGSSRPRSRPAAFVAVFGLAAFIIRELTAPVPAVDLSLFKDRVFLSGTLIGALMFAILMSITFLLPLFMQELLGFPALHAGQALMPRALAMMVGIPLVGRLYNKVQPRILVIARRAPGGVQRLPDVALHAGDQRALGRPGDHDSGVGFASLFVPLTTVALARIPRYRLTDAAGLNSLLRQIGGSLGLAAFATLLPRYVVQARTGLVRPRRRRQPRVRRAALGAMQAALGGRGLDPSAAREAALRILNGTLAQQASVLAFERMFLTAGLAFLFVIPLALLLRRPPGTRPPPKLLTSTEKDHGNRTKDRPPPSRAPQRREGRDRRGPGRRSDAGARRPRRRRRRESASRS